MHETLVNAINETHVKLDQGLNAVAAALDKHEGRAEILQLADTVLAGTSRHVSAVCQVLLPAVSKHLPDGGDRARAYVRQCKRLERALAQTKRRLYGEAYARARPWADIWSDLQTELDRTENLEGTMVDDLMAALDLPACGDLASRVDDAERSGPTRPHPNWPHIGHMASLARSFWARVDRIWDVLEGRVVSAHPHADSPDEDGNLPLAS